MLKLFQQVLHFSRFKAAAAHFVLSALIAGVTVLVMLTLWYPPPLFGAMGGTQLLLLIVGVDICIGPLITLIIFDVRKGKQLLVDLSIIAALQLSALSYGVYAMHAGRPVFITFVENKFAVPTAAAIDSASLAKALPEFRTLPETGPILAAALAPKDFETQQLMLFINLSGYGLENLPEYYVPYDSVRAVVKSQAAPLDQLILQNDSDHSTLQAVIEKSGKPRAKIHFLPTLAGIKTITALVDADSGAFIKLLDINPVSVNKSTEPNKDKPANENRHGAK